MAIAAPTKPVEALTLTNVTGAANTRIALAHMRNVRLAGINVTIATGPILKTDDVTGTGLEPAAPLD